MNNLDFNAAAVLPTRPVPRLNATVDTAGDFRRAMLGDLGHAPPAFPAGRLQRFPTSDRRQDDAGWCVLFPDGRGGLYGDWRTGQEYHWWAEAATGTPGIDPAHLQQLTAETRQALQQVRAAEQQQAALRAEALWSAASAADPSHPYLVRKQIQPDGLRQSATGDLIIPLIDADGELQSVQFIRGDGEKRFLAQGKAAGGHYWLGTPHGAAKLLIAEGYATAASLHAATGYPTVVAFSGHNLTAVAQLVKARFPQAHCLICGDADAQADGSNPGRHYAEQAAAASGVPAVFPRFADATAGSDFNDLLQQAGAGLVRRQVAAAFAAPNNQPLQIRDWQAQVRFAGTPEPRRWLVEGIFPLAQPALVAASGGVGKSFLLLALARAVAAECGQWLNKPEQFGSFLTNHGAAVYFTAEDDAIEVHNRLRALGEIPDRLYVVPLPDAGGARPLFSPNPQTKAPGTTPVWQDWEAQLQAMDGLTLVVFDPLQPLCALDLNVPENAQFVCSRLAALAASTGAAVIVSHHFAKREATTPEQAREAIRGTGGLVDGVRAVYALWLPKEEVVNTVCKRLNMPPKRGQVVQGGVVKANGRANLQVTTYVRDERGLLCDHSEPLRTQSGAYPDQLALMREAIATAAHSGKPYTKTGINGVYERRFELPAAFQEIGKHRLVGMVEALLTSGEIVQALAAGSSSRSVKWLDVPEGRIAGGEDHFQPGFVQRFSGEPDA